jgi:hypothetical protein
MFKSKNQPETQLDSLSKKAHTQSLLQAEGDTQQPRTTISSIHPWMEHIFLLQPHSSSPTHHAAALNELVAVAFQPSKPSFSTPPPWH